MSSMAPYVYRANSLEVYIAMVPLALVSIYTHQTLAVNLRAQSLLFVVLRVIYKSINYR